MVWWLGGGQELQNTKSSENEIWTLKGPKNSAQAGGTLIFHVAKVVRVVLKVPRAKKEVFFWGGGFEHWAQWP